MMIKVTLHRPVREDLFPNVDTVISIGSLTAFVLSCLFVSVLCTLFFTQLFVGMQMMKNSHCLQYLISQSENSFFVTTRLSFVLTSDFVPHIPLFLHTEANPTHKASPPAGCGGPTPRLPIMLA